MAGKAVSYQFLDVLAKSIGMDAETIKQALAEINQLQQQTQALEVTVQDRAPTNHASQQAIFGTADKQMYGHVKIAHEVTNDSTDGVAVSPDAVFAYAPNRNTTPLGTVVHPSVDVIVDGSPAEDVHVSAQLNGNALSLSWGNDNYNKLSAIYIDVPPTHKYEAINSYATRTNGGIMIHVSYNPKDNIVSITTDGVAKAYDSVLLLLAPNNA